MIYQIANWGMHFESWESKRLKDLTWVRVTNRFDGRGFRRIARHPEGAAIFGVWMLIVEIASQMPVRGLLVDKKGRAIGPAEMEDMTGFPEDAFAHAIDVLIDPRIGWIEERSMEGRPPTALGGRQIQGVKTEGGIPTPAANRKGRNSTADLGGSTADQGSKTAESTPSTAESGGPTAESALFVGETDRQREKTPAGSQAGGFEWKRHRPTDLPKALHDTWESIARHDGGEIANQALQAARRIYGPTFSHGQLAATHQAAHRLGILDRPASHWPDPRAKVERPAQDGFPTIDPDEQTRILREMAAAGLLVDDRTDGIE